MNNPPAKANSDQPFDDPGNRDMSQRFSQHAVVFVLAGLLVLPAPTLAQSDTASSATRQWSTDERDTLTALYEHGGILFQVDNRASRRVIAIDFSGHPDINNDWLRHLLPFKELTSLCLAGTAVTDDGLKYLAQFPKLSNLSLNDTPITDSGLKELVACKSLKNVDLRGTSASPIGVDTLRKTLPEVIVESSQPRTQLSPEEALRKIKAVEGVSTHRDDRLPGNPVTMIDATNVALFSDDALAAVIDLPEVRQIGLSGTAITDASASTLATSRQLDTLVLANTALTDSGLVRLSSCQRLQTLDVSQTLVTQSGISTLRKNLPKLNIIAEPEKLSPVSDAAALRVSDKLGAPVVQRFSESQIRNWRARANLLSRLPNTTPEGWSKSPVDPAILLNVFPRLRLREGYVLRAYVFVQDGNSNGFVWALPADADFPEPDDCPRVESHFLKPPKPIDALDDTMEAIIGDDSVASYFQASLLRRELKEFGTGWHGISWGMNMVFDDDPWKPRIDLPEEMLARFPVSRPDDWKWLEAKPDSWVPEGSMDAKQTTITFYSYTPLAADGPGDEIEKERIYRHTETYRRGKYRPLVKEKKIAEGPDAIAF